MSNRTLNWLATTFMCLMIAACGMGMLHGLDREAEINEARMTDFCRAHRVQCDVALANLRNYELGRQ